MKKYGDVILFFLVACGMCFFLVLLPDVQALKHQRALYATLKRENKTSKKQFVFQDKSVDHQQDYLQILLQSAEQQGVAILSVRLLKSQLETITNVVHLVVAGTLPQLLLFLSLTDKLPYFLGIDSFRLSANSSGLIQADLYCSVNSSVAITHTEYQFDLTNLNYFFSKNQFGYIARFVSDENNFIVDRSNISVYAIKFSGLIEQDNKKIALLELPSHHLIRVKLKDILGVEFAQLIAINPNYLLFQIKSNLVRINAQF